MSLRPLIERLLKARSELVNTRPIEAERIGNDVLNQVKRRIQNFGETATGEKFKGYSEIGVPYWFYEGKNVNQGGSQARLLKDYGYFVSYKQFREASNRETGHYNATFTGEMIRSTHSQVIQHSETRTAIEFIPRTQDGKNKLEWQDARNDRPTLEPSKEEIAMAEKANRERVEKILNKAFRDA